MCIHKSHQHLSRNEYITKTHKYIDQTKLTVLNSRGMCFAVTSGKAKKHYKPRAVNTRRAGKQKN